MSHYIWKYGPGGGYESDVDIDRKKVDDAVKKLLATATEGDAWRDPQGTKHIPILVNGEVAGNLWAKAKLGDLKLAGYWAAPFGVKAELSDDGKIVGMVWVDA